MEQERRAGDRDRQGPHAPGEGALGEARLRDQRVQGRELRELAHDEQRGQDAGGGEPEHGREPGRSLARAGAPGVRLCAPAPGAERDRGDQREHARQIGLPGEGIGVPELAHREAEAERREPELQPELGEREAEQDPGDDGREQPGQLARELPAARNGADEAGPRGEAGPLSTRGREGRLAGGAARALADLLAHSRAGAAGPATKEHVAHAVTIAAPAGPGRAGTWVTCDPGIWVTGDPGTWVTSTGRRLGACALSDLLGALCRLFRHPFRIWVDVAAGSGNVGHKCCCSGGFRSH